ncbi:hypothetical protein KEM09_05250 [Carboxylicivirga mesophila]|uniref:DUF3857 domain-containing protein n=1 Tax=Carboxylicivirga mesophila TaxID=1166478 RepID=A0ABS5K734_9BACT|nr:hypothetical protein [Carboxylicivirga mesophila]MBS2210793.1 hypothetical protein [Carboxylicivirga mesophila]
MKRNILATLFLLTALIVNAQKAPIKFGKVSKEEVEMTTYEPDTSAAAVVLCKYGRFSASDFKFTRIERIKILKKSGTKYAEFIFPGRENDTFRGRTYNLVDGEVVEDKLKRESIFKERVTERYFRYRVALPNVKEGSVIEVETSTVGLPTEWTFQRSIPVKHCELLLEESNYINYRKRMVGYEPIDHSDGKRFIARNVPAFKAEAYINSKENYITKFEFDLLSVNFPGYYESFTTSWEAVNDRLMESDYFGSTLKSGGGYLSDIVKEIEAQNLSPIDRAKAAFEAIKTVKWNNEIWIFTSGNLMSKPFKEKVGNSTDINFMLIHLLKKLDIEVYPVVISTRNNGMLNPFYPSYEKLNYTLVCAKIDDKNYLLDATEQELEFGMLPLRCLNHQGRIVTNQQGQWVDIIPSFRDYETVFYDLQLDENLTLEGEVNYSRTGYAAYDFRKKFKKYAGDEDYLVALESKHNGLIIKDFSIDNAEEISQPVRDKYEVELKNKVERINDMVMLNPFLLEKVNENPFKLEKREYPVDFAYCRTKYLVSNITIPDGYTISELPQAIRIVTPDKSVSVMIQHQQKFNKLMTVYKFNINKTMFLPDEYAQLKLIYEQIIKKHAEPVILKPISDAASL